MSVEEFNGAFSSFLGDVKAYNASQRSTILGATKSALADVLKQIGQPLPEPAAAPAAAAPAQAAAPAASAPAPSPTAAGSASSVTGAKPSSRVNAAPGGKSTISLGDDGEKPSTSHGRKQYNNANSSTIQFGASDEAKSSVKVHAAPGGASSISFGDDSNPSEKSKPVQRTDRLTADDAAAHPKKHQSHRKMIHAAGGETHDIFNTAPDQGAKTSVKVHAAPGGASNFSLAHDGTPAAATPKNGAATPTAAAAAAAPAKEAEADAASPSAAASASSGSSEVSPALIKEIIAAVYRKGKVKDTFTKFNNNTGKTVSTVQLKDGVVSLGINISEAQAATIMSQFAKDVKAGMSYPEFMKMMSA